MSKECCEKNGCKSKKGRKSQNPSMSITLILVIMGMIIITAIASCIKIQKRANKPNQQIICDFTSYNICKTNEVFLSPLTDDSRVKLIIISEKQKYICSKPISRFVTHTEVLPDGTEIKVEIE